MLHSSFSHSHGEHCPCNATQLSALIVLLTEQHRLQRTKPAILCATRVKTLIASSLFGYLSSKFQSGSLVKIIELKKMLKHDWFYTVVCNRFSVLTPNSHCSLSSTLLFPFFGIYVRPFEQTVEASDALSVIFALYLAIEVTIPEQEIPLVCR